MASSFPVGVAEKLGTYVYRLIDPRDGQTFYVGRGKGDRVFAHARAKIADDEVRGKLCRIRDIIKNGFEVAHVIHRHGMDEKTAIVVEAALIDAYPGLTNAVDGAGTEFAVMHADEVIRKYQAEPAVFEHKVVLININRSATEQELYEATRYAWKIDPNRAGRADFVLATSRGLIIGVFEVEQWLAATKANFPDRTPRPGRFGFVGASASGDIWRKYVGKSVPEEYRKQGAANPVKYSYR